MAENLLTMWEALGLILSTGSEENTHAHRKEKETPKGILILAFLTNWEMQRSLCLDSNHGPAGQNYRDRTHSFGLSDSPTHCIYRVLVAPRTEECRPTRPAWGGGRVPSWRCLGNSSVYSIAAHPESSAPALTFCSFTGLTGKEKWNHPRSLESRD